MINSIKDVVKNDMCISCGACTFAKVGGKGRMVESLKKGIYIPESLDQSEDAFDVCPGKGYAIEAMANSLFPEAGFEDIELGRWEAASAVHSNSEEILENASSGGIMTGLAKYLLDEQYVDGIITTKFSYGGSGPRPDAFIATTLEQLIESQGSKYCPVPVFSALEDIDSFDGRLLFIGTPCQIAALRLVQEKKPELKTKIPLTIGNFCGGYRDLSETDKIIARAEFDKNLITKFRYRGGGQPGSMLLEDKQGRSKKLPYPEYARMTGVVKYQRCRLCVDATAELADFACGDAWLPKYMKSDKAWSIVLARSPKAASIMAELEKQSLVSSENISVDEIKKSQMGNLTSKKYRQQSRMKLYRILGIKTPEFDGGFYKNAQGLLLEFKVHISHSIFSILEKVGLYKVFSKLIGRYPRGCK